MVKVKGKTTGPAPELANVRVSDSKPSGSSRPSSPEVEENSAPASTARNDRGVGTEAFAGPSAKKEKLQQQLAHVEHQILDLEKLLASSSDPAYSVFKGYSGLLSGNKRKAANQLPEKIFSDSSVKSL